MAITATPLSSDLIIHVEKDGGTGTIARKYADVKVSATDADVYDVANGTNGLAKLQSRVFAGVNRTNTVEIADI